MACAPASAATNVLFVILDAGRADHFGAYGYARADDAEHRPLRARRACVFERVFTPAVYTLGAMSSVWTSQYPDRHHAEVSFAARLPKDRLTLAELLGGAGHPHRRLRGQRRGRARSTASTAASPSSTRSSASVHERARTCSAQAVPDWLAAQTAAGASSPTSTSASRTCPYDPPPPFDTRFGPDGPIPRRRIGRGPGTWITDVNQGRRPLSAPEEREHLVRLYDGNLAFADQEMGALRAALEKASLLETTVVIVAADHGEALLEHGWIGHNVQLYEREHARAAHRPLPRGPGAAGGDA